MDERFLCVDQAQVMRYRDYELILSAVGNLGHIGSVPAQSTLYFLAFEGVHDHIVAGLLRGDEVVVFVIDSVREKVRDLKGWFDLVRTTFLPVAKFLRTRS